MARWIGWALLMMGAAGSALGTDSAPEIDASSGVSAVTLLAGGLLVLRSRRGKR